MNVTYISECQIHYLLRGLIMRALPVSRDVIDLLVTAAFISTTAYQDQHQTPAQLVAEADRMGQLLWDENHRSVSFAHIINLPAPSYTWQPVFEISYEIDVEQALQIERCRLFFAEVSCQHHGWDGSEARAFTDRLGHAIDRHLAGHRIVDSAEHAGVLEYEGLSRALEEWERPVGFRHRLTADAAAAVV